VFATAPNDYVLMTRPTELVGRPGLVNEGALIKEFASGRIAGHMVEVSRLSGDLLQMAGNVASVVNLGIAAVSFAYMRSQFNALNKRLDHIEHKVEVIDDKLNALIGMVQRVDAKVDTLALALSALRGKIDSRHRDDVFAEIGAVLDTLGYADRKAPQDASMLVMNNLTPARKAIRRFASLIDEYEQSLGPADIGLIETTRMRFLLGILSIKIDLALGEKEAAAEQAVELKSAITGRLGALVDGILREKPVRVLAQNLAPERVIQLCRTLEAIDGVPPLHRLAADLAAPALAQALPNAADRGNWTTIVMECGVINEWNSIAKAKPSHEGPFILCGKAELGTDEMGGITTSKRLWRFEGKLKKEVGESVRRGESLLEVRLWDAWTDSHVLSADMVSPIDGTVLEDLTLDSGFDTNPYGKLESYKTLFPYTGICKIAPGVAPAQQNSGGDVDSLIEGFETLAKLNAAVNGVALETSFLAHDAAAAALAAPGNTPFSQDYFIMPAAVARSAA
jgi:hypothetical protein